MLLHLLVGVDTEADNQWDAAARARPTLQNIYALARLHSLFRRYRVRPTYLLTYSVATDRRAAESFREMHAAGECEVGAHHHAWETPPFTEQDVQELRYALAVPLNRFEAQVGHLTDAIEVASGARPVSYRSGRFGFAAAHVSVLEKAGYLVDSSVAPLFYEAYKDGPDFVEAPLDPYFLSYDSAVTPGSSNVLEVPASAGLDRRAPAPLVRAYARAPFPYHTKRILRKLGLARTVWLRPSYASVDEMKRLARRIAGDGLPALNMIFHSSEIIPGGSPYNSTAAEVDAWFDRLERFLAWATDELRAVPATFQEFRARLCAAAVECAEPQAEAPH